MHQRRFLRALFLLSLLVLPGLLPASPARADYVSIVQVSAGGDHTCALKADGSVVCWGSSAYGQLNVPAPNTGFIQISVGLRHACGINNNYRIVCWGDNHRGQTTVPVLPEYRRYIQVSAGDLHTCGLVDDGSIVCWGDNLYGQRNVPSPNSGFTQVAAGSQHTCGLKDTQMVCWGENTFGQGNVVAGDYQQIAAGRNHTCGLTLEGGVICWGNDNYGQVSSTPAVRDFTQISAGYEFSCARAMDGTLTCWGFDSDGQVSNTPADPRYMQVAAGLYHTCAIRDDNTVLCWGDNAYNQAPVISLPYDLPGGEVGTAYSRAVTASGGALSSPRYAFSLVSGYLPPGLSLAPGGQITGTPYQYGSWSFTLRAVDDIGIAGERAYTLSIAKGTPSASLSITNSPRTYTGLPQPAAVEITTSSVPGTLANVLYNGSPVVPTAAGTYAVTADFIPAYSTSYHTLTGINAGDLIIQPAVLTVRADDQSRLVGQPNPPLTWTTSGFVNGETAASAGLTGEPAVSTTASESSVPGSYPIAVAQNSDPQYRLAAANYSFNFVNGTLTVTGAPDITLSVTNSPRIYTGLPQPAVVAITASSAPGRLANVRYNGLSAVPTAAGTYAVTADFLPDDAVHYSSLTGLNAGDLVIQPAVLTVRADNQSRRVGEPNPRLTWTISGFVNGETAESAGLTGEPAVSTAASAFSLPGSYPITITQNGTPEQRLNAANYTFHFVNGTLIVAGSSVFLPLVMW